MKRLARTRSSEQPDEAPVGPAAIVRFGTIASVDLSTGEVEVDCNEELPLHQVHASHTQAAQRCKGLQKG